MQVLGCVGCVGPQSSFITVLLVLPKILRSTEMGHICTQRTVLVHSTVLSTSTHSYRGCSNDEGK